MAADAWKTKLRESEVNSIRLVKGMKRRCPVGSRGGEVSRPGLTPLCLPGDDRDQWMDEPIASDYVLNLELVATMNRPFRRKLTQLTRESISLPPVRSTVG